MKSSERLQKRYDELAFGPTKWVHRSPSPTERNDTACLMVGGQYPLDAFDVANCIEAFERTAKERGEMLSGATISHLLGFNDDPDRKLSEVLDLLDRAVQVAKEKEAEEA